ncbi:uncharacterized protein LOC122877909 isoform X2 [Scomber scombrus]|uniref:Uncharacterized protein LOC122877909 isoform X2 n=1 Tax=Scomber scombrus TaxID=13677 RepID=A0AAV1QAM0_SCOSC
MWERRSLKMLSCFTSSDPGSENASHLYDENNDVGHLWRRESQHFPLPPCLPLPSPPPDSRCLVCRDQAVYAVCRNLTDGVKMIMEAKDGWMLRKVKISQADCPEPPSDEPPVAIIIIIIISVLLLFLVFIGLVCYRRYKSRS